MSNMIKSYDHFKEEVVEQMEEKTEPVRLESLREFLEVFEAGKQFKSEDKNDYTN